jgi:hypothetical protein
LVKASRNRFSNSLIMDFMSDYTCFRISRYFREYGKNRKKKRR